MATLLGDGELLEEARAALLEAMLASACARAVQSRLPEPVSLDDAFLPPLSHMWGDALPMLRDFVADAAHPWRPALEKLAEL